MENSESSNSINEEQNELSRKFLKITNVKIFSNAYNIRLKEDDIIIGFNGEYFNSSYEDLKKALDADQEEKIIAETLKLATLLPSEQRKALRQDVSSMENLNKEAKESDNTI